MVQGVDCTVNRANGLRIGESNHAHAYHRPAYTNVGAMGLYCGIYCLGGVANVTTYGIPDVLWSAYHSLRVCATPAIPDPNTNGAMV